MCCRKWMVVVGMVALARVAVGVEWNAGFEVAAPVDKQHFVDQDWQRRMTNVFGIFRTNAVAHSGQFSVRSELKDQGIRRSFMVHTNTMADSRVRLSVWALIPHDEPLRNKRGLLAMRFFDATNALCDPEGMSAAIVDDKTPTGIWVYGSLTAMLPERCARIDTVLQQSWGDAGVVYFDDAKLEILDATNDLGEDVNLERRMPMQPDPAGEAWLTSMTCSANLIKNPGFEQDSNQEGGFRAASWERFENTAQGPSRTAFIAHGGRYSCKIDRHGERIWPLALNAAECGEFGGSEIDVSLWVLTPKAQPLSNSAARVTLEFYNARELPCTPFNAATNVLDDRGPVDTWVKRTLRARIPSDCARIGIAVARSREELPPLAVPAGVNLADMPEKEVSSRFMGSGAVYIDDVEALITQPAQAQPTGAAGRAGTQEWMVAGPYVLRPAREYESNYFLNVFRRLPKEWQGIGEGVSLDGVPSHWRHRYEYHYSAPHVMPFVAWSKAVTNSLVPGYIHIDNKNQTFCQVSMPWPSLRIEGKWQARELDIPAGGTNVLVTFDPAAWAAGETRGMIAFAFPVFGVVNVPVEVDAGGALRRTGFDTVKDTRWRAPEDWRGVAAVREQPAGLESVGENSLLFAQRNWVSPIAQDAEIRLGSDDAVKVWHNGKPLFEYPYARGYTRGKNVLPVKLAAGTNVFLFALVNALGPAALGAQVFPARMPLDGQLELRTDVRGEDQEVADEYMPLTERLGALCTGAYVSLDYYWMPAAGTNAEPHYAPWPDKPQCDWL